MNYSRSRLDWFLKAGFALLVWCGASLVVLGLVGIVYAAAHFNLFPSLCLFVVGLPAMGTGAFVAATSLEGFLEF